MPDELLLVPMDGMLIRQVIMNLFENAAIHADGMTKITLDISREGENAVFRVTDDGRGIDPNLLPHILEGDFKRSVGSSEDAGGSSAGSEKRTAREREILHGSS